MDLSLDRYVLAAQPGESQRRPATHSSSQLIVRIGLPALWCSRCLCPGPDQAYIRQWACRPKSGTENCITVTNPIERLNEEFRRRIKTQTVLPCSETSVP